MKRPQSRMQRRGANEWNGEFDDNLPDSPPAQDEAFDDDLLDSLLAQGKGIMQRREANERGGEFDDSPLGSLLAQDGAFDDNLPDSLPNLLSNLRAQDECPSLPFLRIGGPLLFVQ